MQVSQMNVGQIKMWSEYDNSHNGLQIPMKYKWHNVALCHAAIVL